MPGPRGEPDDRDQHAQRRAQQPREHDHQRQRRDHQEPVLEARRGSGRSSRRSSRRRGRRPSRGPPRSTAAAKPTTIETRAPTRICEKTSAPFSVVPRMWSSSAAASTSRLEAFGSYGASAVPKIATNANRPRIAEPEPPAPGAEQQARGSAPARPAARDGASLARMDLDRARRMHDRLMWLRAHRDLHPRVEVEVEAVGEQVGEDHPDREDEEGPCSTGKSLSLIAVEAELAEPGPGEDRLDRDRAAGDRRRTGSPTAVTSGSSAFGTAWLRTTRCHGSPVARLTVTKSSVSTSTIDERMIRKYWPSSISVIAVAGRIRWSRTSIACVPPARELDPGRHLQARREDRYPDREDEDQDDPDPVLGRGVGEQAEAEQAVVGRLPAPASRRSPPSSCRAASPAASRCRPAAASTAARP